MDWRSFAFRAIQLNVEIRDCGDECICVMNQTAPEAVFAYITDSTWHPEYGGGSLKVKWELTKT